jgi:hypothetical protein
LLPDNLVKKTLISRMTGYPVNATTYHINDPLGFDKVEKVRRIPGMLERLAEIIHAGKRAQMPKTMHTLT